MTTSYACTMTPDDLTASLVMVAIVCFVLGATLASTVRRKP